MDKTWGWWEVSYITAVEIAQRVIRNIHPVRRQLIIDRPIPQRRQSLIIRRAGARRRIIIILIFIPASLAQRASLLTLLAIMLPNRSLILNHDLDSQVTRVYSLLQQSRQEAVGEARLSHPADILSRQIRLGYDTDRLRQEGQRARRPLRDGDEIQRRHDTLYRRQGRETGTRAARQVAAHRIATTARHLHDRDLSQRTPSIRTLSKPIENFMRQSIPRARDHHIKGLDIQFFCDRDRLPLARGGVYIELDVRGAENRFNIPDPPFHRAALPRVRVQEHLRALALLRLAVRAVEELGDPDACWSRVEGEGVGEKFWADGGFGDGGCEGDGEEGVGGFGPEDVVEGDGAGV